MILRQPQLYRLNQVTTAQFKVNLTIILSTESDLNLEAISDMPTEQEIEHVFLFTNNYIYLK